MYASTILIGAGALMVTTVQTAEGYTTIVAGQLHPFGSIAVSVAAMSANQPTAAMAQSAVEAFFTALVKTLGYTAPTATPTTPCRTSTSRRPATGPRSTI